MPLEIIESCVNCWACEQLCPTGAIHAAEPHFLIEAKKCSGCDGDYATPQCAAVCPVEGAILDGLGEAVNPPGSLSGVSPARMAEVMAEIRAR